MISSLLSRIVILVLGTLYPAYASYKAVKTKNVKEYVKWMMYWIVFALFTCAETIADIFISWVPFYYEIKIVFVLWLLSPTTRGSSILYRRFVHPLFAKREEEIDSYIARVGNQGYSALLAIGSKGINYATNVVVSTALKGQATLVEQMKRSHSTGDLSQQDNGGGDDVADGQLLDAPGPSTSDAVLTHRSVLSDDTEIITEEEVMSSRMSHEVTKKPRRKYKHDEVAHYGTVPRRRTRASHKMSSGEDVAKE